MRSSEFDNCEWIVIITLSENGHFVCMIWLLRLYVLKVSLDFFKIFFVIQFDSKRNWFDIRFKPTLYLLVLAKVK